MAFLPYDQNIAYYPQRKPEDMSGYAPTMNTPVQAVDGTASGGQANVPLWMQPWTGSAYAASAPAAYTGGGVGWNDITAPAGYGGTFDYRAETFNAPTGLTYLNDPGYQARMKMGTDALEASAAARGTLLTGGTAKALAQFGQDYGSNEFQNVYNRALGTYQANEGNRYNAAALNQGGRLQAHGIDSGHQMQAAMTNAQGQLSAAQANQANAQFGYNAGLGAYDRRYQAYRDDQAAAFDRPFSLAQLGYNAASNASGQYGNYATGGAARQGDYWTQGANATAAGQVASGNAWGGALGSIGNNVAGMYLASQYGSNPSQTARAPYTPSAPPATTASGFRVPNYSQYW